jgi:Tol biopolymer transport system component
MRKTLSTLARLISIGSLSTLATESVRVAAVQSSQSLDGSACFALVEKVAFTTTRDNPTFVPIQNAAEIYLMNPDGSDPQRITENEVQDTFPVLSPDGKKIVFDSNRLRTESEPINMVDLFVMASDGTEQTYLTRGSSASWAPDAKHITFHASASGTGLPIRMDPGAPPTDSDVFIVNVDDSATGQQVPINITNSETLIEDDPHWSPDAQRIVYVAHEVNDVPEPGGPAVYPTAEIFVINADGSGAPVQLTSNAVEERAPAWSPDGSQIAFMCRYGGTDFEICVMNADGSGLVQVTSNTVQELSIRWSVDGQKFFFNRPVSGVNQLFSINVDSTGEMQLTSPVGINLFPAPGLLRVKTDCASSTSRLVGQRFSRRQSAWQPNSSHPVEKLRLAGDSPERRVLINLRQLHGVVLVRALEGGERRSGLAERVVDQRQTER